MFRHLSTLFTKPSFLLLVVVPHLASAHFYLKYPATIGFDDDNESISPCGGFDVPSAETTNGTSVGVGGFSVYVQRCVL